MQGPRILVSDNAPAVNICRCPRFGMCITVPSNMDLGTRRQHAQELLTRAEDAAITEAFRSGLRQERDRPAACPRLRVATELEEPSTSSC